MVAMVLQPRGRAFHSTHSQLQKARAEAKSSTSRAFDSSRTGTARPSAFGARRSFTSGGSSPRPRLAAPKRSRTRQAPPKTAPAAVRLGRATGRPPAHLRAHRGGRRVDAQKPSRRRAPTARCSSSSLRSRPAARRAQVERRVGGRPSGCARRAARQARRAGRARGAPSARELRRTTCIKSTAAAVRVGVDDPHAAR